MSSADVLLGNQYRHVQITQLGDVTYLSNVILVLSERRNDDVVRASNYANLGFETAAPSSAQVTVLRCPTVSANITSFSSLPNLTRCS